ncbi:MAG: PEGA domain-containing protein [bacterium]
MLACLITVVIIFSQDAGYLNVDADQSDLSVYLDGDYIGTTPITNYSIEPGEYSISLYDSKTIENEYWNLRSASPFRKLSSIWQLTRIDAATKKVKILSNQSTKIFYYTSRINRAPTLAKCVFGGCIGGIFGLGILAGVLIASIAR